MCLLRSIFNCLRSSSTINDIGMTSAHLASFFDDITSTLSSSLLVLLGNASLRCMPLTELEHLDAGHFLTTF